MRSVFLCVNRLGASIALVWATVSCGRIGFELLPTGNLGEPQTGGAGSGGSGSSSPFGDATVDAPGSGASGAIGSGGARTSTGGATGAGATSAGGAAAEAGSRGGGGGSISAGGGTGRDAAAGGTASSGGTSTGDAARGTAPDAAPPPVCASGAPSLKAWSFDSTVEGWAFWPNTGVTGTLSQTLAVGNPTPGALAANVQSGSGKVGWIVLDSAAPNLTGQTASVWVYLDSAVTGVGVKIYMQSDPKKYAWADGGFVTLTPKTWTCLSINMDAPTYKDATFDPTMVVRFGVEVTGTAPFTLYADQFEY